MDRKHEIAISVTVGIICFILVSIVFMQFKTVEETNITQIQNMRETELKIELANWKTKYEEVNQKLQEDLSILEEYRNNSNTNTESANTLRQELQKTNMLLGRTNIRGSGIIITLKDLVLESGEKNNQIDESLLTNYSPITDEDFIVIINELIDARGRSNIYKR